MWYKSGVISIILVQLLTLVPSRLIDVNDKLFDEYANTVNKMSKTMEAMKKIIGALSRQTMLQQLFVEERIRSDGNSGVKQVRVNIDGTRNYHTATHTGGSVVSIHDHSNNIRTVGMGEFIGVLNGVEFRTRHNDYRLYMPSKTSKDWNAKEPIPFPDVPPEVLKKKTVKEQTEEMRAWFKAWRDQNATVRNYTNYFKPVLCYLEGAWTTSTEGKVEEPFDSDRHFVDAASWFDLHEKIRFTSYTGRKDNLENFSFLPTTIMNVTEGYPEFAQWNYRIMCHPLSKDLPLNRFRVIDELGLRMTHERTLDEHKRSRAARFQLNPLDKETWTDKRNGDRWGLLDDLMSEIPGKDNYMGNLSDEAFDLVANSNKPEKRKQKLRADRYHRFFRVSQKGAMGTSTRHRGFADENLFMAMNNQSKVAGMGLRVCKWNRQIRKTVCKTINQKWSYAIPLEIIYLTPLSKWNPYDIQYKGDSKSDLGKTVEQGGRNGGLSEDKAYNGIHSRKFYQTPVELFTGSEIGSDKADTTRNTVGVLDKKGNVRKCKASGTRIFFPLITGVGILRQRYPIVPVHGEGSSVWKELEATKDLLLKSKTNGYMFREPLHNGPIPTEPPRKDIQLQMATAKPPEDSEFNPGPHEHELTLTADQVDFVNNGGTLQLISTERAGHSHQVKVIAWRGKFYMTWCDGKPRKGGSVCEDRHSRKLIKMPDQ